MSEADAGLAPVWVLAISTARRVITPSPATRTIIRIDLRPRMAVSPEESIRDWTLPSAACQASWTRGPEGPASRNLRLASQPRLVPSPRSICHTMAMSEEITRVGVVGAGTMGNGIAQVFAQSGFDVRLIDAADGRARARARDHRQEPRRSSSRKASSRPATATPPSAASTPARRSTTSPTRTSSSKPSSRTPRPKARLFARLDAITPPGGDPRLEHVVDFDHDARRRDEAAGQSARHALHEPGAADDARRADSRAGDVDRVDGDGVGPVRAPGQDAVEAADYPGFIANRILMPMINEAIYRADGRRRHAGGDRHRHEARDESSDGTADARRLHRPRRLPRDSRTCCTTASAIRSTGRVRSCAGWSRRAISAASPAAGSTAIDSSQNGG